MDRDETLSQAIQREIMEEGGYTIENLQFFRINDNPNRPVEDRQNIDMIFAATAKKKVSNPDEEVSELRWFDLNKLPPKKKFAFDHHDNILLYINHQTKPYSLPIINQKIPKI